MFARSFATLFLLLAVGGPVMAQGIPWRHDLAAAQQEAAQSGKLVLLHFWDTTCGPCLALDKNVFNQPQVADAIQRLYVPVKVDPATAAPLAEKYGVTRIPTDVVLSPQGEMVQKLVSPPTPMAYVGQMTRLATSYRNQAGAAFQQAAQQSPYNHPLNDAYRGLNLSTPSTPATAQTQPPARQTPAAPPAVVENRYAVQPPVAQPPAATAPATEPQGQVASKPPTQQQLPPGSPPIGFDGFCTVCMQRDFKWVPGRVEWGAVHRGRTYVFAGQAERDEFLRSPDTYSPVLSGMDPVAAVEENKAVAGKRQFAVQYPPQTGQFYLFSSEENLKKFSTNAAGYAEGVRQAMSPGAGRVLR